MIPDARSAWKAGLLLALLAGLCGCAARRDSLPRNYRLAGFPAGEFILPPDFSGQPAGADHIRVPLGTLAARRSPAASAKCSIHDRFFSLERINPGKGWTATLPTPVAWNHQELAVNAQARWGDFLAQIESLEAAGCIAPQDYEKALALLEQSMPAPAVLASFFRDPLGNRGFVALHPGMRLFIERSIFRNAGPETVANYWGETKVYYRVVRQPDGKIALKLSRVQRSHGLPRGAGHEFPDLRLGQSFQHLGAVRLFLLTLYVPPSLKRNGLLVGVRDPGDMVAVLQKIEKNPEIPCRDFGSSGVTCATFEGMVSASAEMNVRVNGKTEYLPVGTKLGDFVRTLPPSDQSSFWKTLRIQRLFRGRLYKVNFNRADPTLPTVALFSGDRMEWRRIPAK